MAATVPASLKPADISRLALRASQLEKAKPIIAYYCKYQIVNTVLAKGLHNADEEALAYTTNLMDELEQFKVQNQDNSAVTDDEDGKAYVEQFGLETFHRADNAVRANKASRQTVDTYQAAATFLDLLHIWGNTDPDIAAKSKYAKFHALRIAKALKAGEDPNLTNPKPEPVPAPDEALPPLDPNDPEVQMLSGGSSDMHRQPSIEEVPDEADGIQKRLAQTSSLDESLHPSRAPSIPRPAQQKPRQPSVVDAPDDTDRMQSQLARQSILNESLHPSRTPSTPPISNLRDVSPLAPNDPSAFYTANPTADRKISPSAPEPPAESSRKSSVGGNYFPQVPPPFAQPPPASVDIPSAPVDARGNPDPINLPSAPSEPSFREAPSSLSQLGTVSQTVSESPTVPPKRHGNSLPDPFSDTTSIQSSMVPQSAPRPQIPQAPPQLYQSHTHIPREQAPPPAAHYGAYAAPPQSGIPVAQHPMQVSPAPENVVVDEEAMMKAQKHARWAISALNFEDVPTAIRELRGALKALGAS